MWKYLVTSLGFLPPNTLNLHLCGGNGYTVCILSVCWEDAGEVGHKVLCGSKVIRSTYWTEENPEGLPHSTLPISSSHSRILNLKREFENPDFKRCSPRNFPKLLILWQEYLFDETLEGIKAITKTILEGSFQNKIPVLGKLVVVVISPVGNWRIQRQMLSLLREGRSWCGTWRYMNWRVRQFPGEWSRTRWAWIFRLTHTFPGELSTSQPVQLLSCSEAGQSGVREGTREALPKDLSWEPCHLLSDYLAEGGELWK